MTVKSIMPHRTTRRGGSARSTKTRPQVKPLGGHDRPPVSDRKSKTQTSSDRLIKDQIWRCVSVILHVFELFGFNSEGYKLSPTLSHWGRFCDAVGGPDAWISVAKYKLAAYFSYHLHQALPVSPCPEFNDHPGYLMGGRAGRWQRLILRDESVSWEFLTTVLYSKKGFPRPPKDSLDRARLKAFTALTTRRQVPARVNVYSWADQDEDPRRLGYFTLADVDRELRRTVDELFIDAKFTLEDKMSPSFPSSSANIDSTVKRGGMIGHLFSRRLQRVFDDLKQPDFVGGEFRLSSRVRQERIRSGFVQSFPDGLDRYPFERIEFLDISYEPTEERVEDEDMFDLFHWDFSALRSRYSRLWVRLLKEAVSEAPNVKLVALSEALKVRTISKGPAASYYVVSSLQSFMWRILKKHPCFALVGKPVDAWYIQERLGKRNPGDKWYLSGDYASATDELHSYVSEVIADQIAIRCGLSTAEHDLLERLLTKHMIWDELTGQYAPQRTGQLMGSPISFPILCIANAAICRFALEQSEHRPFTLTEAPLAINGDDVVCRMSEHGKFLWKKLTAFIGLRESVGKTYWSQKFCNMNSRNFVLSEQPVDSLNVSNDSVKHCYWKQTPFVHMGLLFGMKRSEGRIGKNDLVGQDSIGQRCRDMISEAPYRMRSILMKSFIARNREVLKGSSPLPWFLPEPIGLGLPLISNGERLEFGPSHEDLRRCFAIIMKGELDKFRSPSDMSWRIDSLVWKRSPNVLHVPNGSPILELSQKVYGHLAVSTLFDSNLRKKDLFREGELSNLKFLERNKRVWSRIKPFGADLDSGRIFNLLSRRLGTRAVPVSSSGALSISESSKLIRFSDRSGQVGHRLPPIEDLTLI